MKTFFSRRIALPGLLLSLFWPLGLHAGSAPPAPPPAGSAPVPNYVFNVPVNVSGLPASVKAKLRCKLTYGAQGRSAILGDWMDVPTGAGGSYSGVLTVKVDYKAASDGTWFTPNSYECDLDFVGPDGKSGPVPPNSQITGMTRGAL